MPGAWPQNFYHIVFSTIDRVPMIDAEPEPRLYPFIGGIVRDLRCSLISINGIEDHVHLLVRYRSDLSHSDLVRHVKSRSSKWIHETFPACQSFRWQEAYGGFTVSKWALRAKTAG